MALRGVTSVGQLLAASSEEFLAVVGDAVHLGHSLLLLWGLVAVLEQGDAGSLVVDRSVRAVVYVSVVQIGELRLERLQTHGTEGERQRLVSR